MIENQIGKRFAEALSDAIQDTAALNPALEALKALREGFETEPHLGRFFIHPGIPEERKQALARELCDRLGAPEPVRRLVGILVDRQKMPCIRNIAEYFEEFVDHRLNRIRVKVVSAHPIGQGELDKLKTSLERLLGKTTILESTEDPSVLGGLRLVVGSQVADATLQNRLAQLRHAIRNEEALSEVASG